MDYLALGGVEIVNAARAFGYARTSPCCASYLKRDACPGLHDMIGPWVPPIYEWQETRRNLFDNPSATSLSGFTSSGAATLAFADAPRWTITGSGVAVALVATGIAAGVAGRLLVRASANRDLAAVMLFGGASGAEVTITTTPAWYEVIATSVGGNSGIALFDGAGHAAGDWIEIDRVLVGGSEDIGDWFSGSSETTEALRYSWAGAAGVSDSIEETYTLTSPGYADSPDYTHANIGSAPWFDPNENASSDFLGVYPLSVDGITDGTLTATTVESITSGGLTGAGRDATRQVRVKVLLLGCTRASVEFGMAWLKAALRPGFCGSHGSACGSTDLAFFTDCAPPVDGGEVDYDETVGQYRRFLHEVSLTTDVLKEAEFATRDGGMVYRVSFVLTADTPFVFGETRSIPLAGVATTAVSDVPYNLMTYPSAEVNDGIAAVVATNYAFNGSVEYGAAGWAKSQAGGTPAAAVTGGQSTDVAAIGPHSYRSQLTAASAGQGTVIAQYDVSLSGMPAGATPSVSMWGMWVAATGDPALEELRGSVEWRTASASLGVVEIGATTDPADFMGANFIDTRLTIPAGATVARVRVEGDLTFAAGDVARLYADAVALTIP